MKINEKVVKKEVAHTLKFIVENNRFYQGNIELSSNSCEDGIKSLWPKSKITLAPLANSGFNLHS